MDTIIKKIDMDSIDENTISKATKVLKNGGTVAFPTETVYGLGADALREEASKKIYAAKGRPSDNPLIVHIADKSALDELTLDRPEFTDKLIDAFWPGPLTMIFKKSDKVPKGTTGGLDTVAIRMPNHKIALELINKSGIYIAAPSANTSGKPSPTTGEHVIDDLNGKIDMIIDAGSVGIGLESTILDMTSVPPAILRPGYITIEMIKALIGEVLVDTSTGVAKAPGMKYRHYAPKADMMIVDGPADKVADKINDLSESSEKEGKRVGIIATEESKENYKYGTVVSIGKRKSEESIAKNLYAVLRDFDDLDVDIIYCESFKRDNFGQAIMNRLTKAAANNILKL